MKKLFLIALLFMFAVISCGADEDDETNDSDSDTDTGKNDPVVEEKEACDKDMTFKCKTDPTDGTEYSYICEGNTSLYLYKYETCKAGCNTSTGKCNPWKDPDTGLTWSSVGIGESPNSSNRFDWDEARKYCNSLEENGLTDWHLPTINELRTLIQNCSGTVTGGSCGVTDSCLSFSSCWSKESCYSCSYDESGGYSKLGDTSWFWSSSVQSEVPSYRWLVLFDDGSVGNLNVENNLYVRCVR
jgi:uncharacterized protein (TIGR02145 family)